jgi:hypothetical protein
VWRGGFGESTSKTLEAARSNLLPEMMNWSNTTGHEIYKSIYITEEQMKDFTRNRPNPTMGMATLATASQIWCASQSHMRKLKSGSFRRS